ncbi:MAG: 2-hydroxyacyl-CoA dehydratase family protein [Deltaproteobacteria bacterium]|nr:2-hydroxyacyl-CoA dehydratase family protein [Deltaproteobacteria bacterium]
MREDNSGGGTGAGGAGTVPGVGGGGGGGGGTVPGSGAGSVLTAEGRAEKIREKAGKRILAEWEAERALLSARDDRHESLDYFLDLVKAPPSPSEIEARLRSRVVGVVCLQAPPELFLALGLHPHRLYGGSLNAAAAQPGLPALMCPLLKSLMGEMAADPGTAGIPWILPTTCDWTAGLPSLKDVYFPGSGDVRVVDLPRSKENPVSTEGWFLEMAGLWKYLKTLADRKPSRGGLLAAVGTVERARAAFGETVRLRREGRVPAVWFLLAARTFFFDRAENWTRAVEGANKHFAALEPKLKNGVFLTGSPVVYPNFKLLHLLEEAGFSVLGDDLCSGERLLFRHVALKDKSVEGVLRALAQTCHDGCLCPVFVENKRRLGPVVEAVRECAVGGGKTARPPGGDKTAGSAVRGVVFHLLKGCHPYEIDSVVLERETRRLGLRFIRLETDYAAEDRLTISNRLEALRPTLDAGD